MTTNTKDQKGFTIIEVVLVLAIAALIFLMVFVAYPALSRGQRDAQRKNDMSRAQTAITNATSSNRGKVPTLDNSFKETYLLTDGDDFSDPSGKEYVFTEIDDANLTTEQSKSAASNPAETTVAVYYTVGGVCDVDGTVKVNQGDRKVALRIPLEGGGIACVNT
jgi:prepilin-type N-terminal cleavage/methylation domain-containing protein